ncbi:hypothetical protein Ciccas_003877 [Cichlidogyrus casuarinus]|uniref:Uncharacterized protein n=1 Tax=Cichlidogyrus casuarinus TaxID=1844966 RepID=A0ABD2QD98_9PLAT
MDLDRKSPSPSKVATRRSLDNLKHKTPSTQEASPPKKSKSKPSSAKEVSQEKMDDTASDIVTTVVPPVVRQSQNRRKSPPQMRQTSPLMKKSKLAQAKKTPVQDTTKYESVSSDNENDDSKPDDIDTFPRLTRRQHKQLMGNESPKKNRAVSETKKSPARSLVEIEEVLDSSPKSARSPQSQRKMDEEMEVKVEVEMEEEESPRRKPKLSKLPVTSPISSAGEEERSADESSTTSTIGMHRSDGEYLIMDAEEVRIERRRYAFKNRHRRRTQDSRSIEDTGSSHGTGRIPAKRRAIRKSGDVSLFLLVLTFFEGSRRIFNGGVRVPGIVEKPSEIRFWRIFRSRISACFAAE